MFVGKVLAMESCRRTHISASAEMAKVDHLNANYFSRTQKTHAFVHIFSQSSGVETVAPFPLPFLLLVVKPVFLLFVLPAPVGVQGRERVALRFVAE